MRKTKAAKSVLNEAARGLQEEIRPEAVTLYDKFDFDFDYKIMNA